MDKRKVIEAYRRGFLTPQECAQVLGIEGSHLKRMLEDYPTDPRRDASLENQSASGLR
ncbi:hypothetical protein D3C76_1825930 [compost metagenome]|jgi:hypothetical protein|uniref:Helix-turn-helix domain-containing protein n=1 Tax=Paenibacillus timonensis TaxID=225915 RepID=A0ABW3S712_9BACL|nr:MULTISPECIES: hypothetical protein [Paenibacillus]MCH1639648.1 hypothetical protein [Paenibacillus timonensis]MDU2239588.1 hypothetical protein [Paenibacillus sp.]GJM80101.1 hypothetical protein HMSSN139_25970 [Paenibacillus sp. HMSSN-139]